MKKIITAFAVIAMAASVASCGVNPSKATRALEAQGMKDVQIEGYAWWGGCAKDDTFQSLSLIHI